MQMDKTKQKRTKRTKTPSVSAERWRALLKGLDPKTRDTVKALTQGVLGGLKEVVRRADLCEEDGARVEEAIDLVDIEFSRLIDTLDPSDRVLN